MPVAPVALNTPPACNAVLAFWGLAITPAGFSVSCEGEFLTFVIFCLSRVYLPPNSRPVSVQMRLLMM